MQREVKCKHCGEWGTLIDENSRCIKCSCLLADVSAAEKASIDRRNSAGELKIKINPNDPWILRILKQTFNVIQFVFLAILSFILWVIFAGPG